MDEVKRKKIETLAKWGIALVGAAVIAPVIFLSIKGLIGLIIAFVIGSTAIAFAPWFAMKLANWKVKAIMHEAHESPIPTLLNQVQEKYQALSRFKDSITNFRTEIANFEEKVKLFSQQYPAEAPKFEQQLEGMKRLLLYRVDKYKAAKKQTEEFEMAVGKARALWDMSQEAQRMNKLAGMQTGDPFEKIKTEVALESVVSSVNQAFSELETALMDDDTAKQLATNHTTALEYKPVPATETVDFSQLPAQPAKIKVRA